MGQSYAHILARADAAAVVAAMRPDEPGYILPLTDGLSAVFVHDNDTDDTEGAGS